MIIELGHFEVNSGQLAVADPCYELNTETIIMGVIDNVLNGAWVGQAEKVEVREWGEACSRLTAYHHTVADQDATLEWVKCPFVVRAESEQAGIFDITKYRLPDAGAPENGSHRETEWYYACCDITESGEEAGVMDGGVVSRTGMGNGSYGVYMSTDGQNQVVGVKVVFIKR
ncbi:DUF4241 domain-containing protein [Paenibacillus sp. HJL G12]|uniref:DUF4241 domain-containing protein n=1 Tax=Paenibacillus dendrobii TaxID=2691084 RepID=A0A7X3IND2_9BACL|nr:DUF4241 domain-containing protein [Paenibacillus dendrobii]MWV47144.1 DUF4241 domain-containing protein [Paenibacillus dendrobii]